MKPHTAKLVLVMVSAGAALLASEGIWRLFFPPPGFSPHSELGAPGLIVPHPRRSYTMAPSFSGRMVTGEFDVAVRTNALGCRIGAVSPGGYEGEDVARNEKGPRIYDFYHPFTILALGDSFTFGHGLDAEAAWPEQLGHVLDDRRRAAGLGAPSRVRIVNAGVSAYNMAQVRDLAEEIAPRVRPDLVVLGLFVNGAERLRNPYVFFAGDAVREAERGRLRAAPGGFQRTPMNRPWLQSLDFTLQRRLYVGAALLEGTYRGVTWISSAPKRVAGWFHRRGADGEAHGPTEAGERAYLAPLLEEVDGVDRLARSLGAPLVVLVIHVQREDGTFREIDGRFSAIVAEYARDHHLAILDPTPVLKERAQGKPIFRYSRLDAHWSAVGHALVAEELAVFLEREMLVPPVSRESTDNRPTPDG